MKYKTTKRNYYRAFAMSSAGALMLMGGAFVALPELDNNTNALTCTSGEVTAVAAGDTASVGDICDTADTDVEVTITEILDITAVDIETKDADGKADFGTATPGQTTLNTNEITVTVDTNVASGYQLQINAEKAITAAEDANANALIRNESPYTTIETLSGDTTAAAFPAGAWGYSLDNGANYKAVPASATPAISYTWQTVDDVRTITTDTTFKFGIKPATDQTAGTYEGKVKFTAVKNS